MTYAEYRILARKIEDEQEELMRAAARLEKQQEAGIILFWCIMLAGWLIIAVSVYNRIWGATWMNI